MKKLKIKKLNLKKKDKNQNINVKETILSIILIGGIALISIMLVFALYIIVSSPDFDKEKLYSKESSVLYYNDGKTELARLGQYDRVLVNYEELPQVLIDAIVATEDSRFFQHSGLDVARFAKASVGQLIGNDKAGGASTLTMQVVKQAYTSGESKGIKGIIRKFTDIYMAVFKVESNYTKEEIIEFYVNSQWFGSTGSLNNSGFAGVEQACQNFFGKSVSDISLAEASIIAGMYQNPSWYNPYTYPERIKKRQKTVLKLMVNHGYITEEEKNAVLDIPIESLLVKKENVSNGDSRAAIDYIINEVKSDTGYDLRETPMKVITTIDKNVQDGLNKLEKGEIYEFPNEYIQEGIAITNMENGGLSAISGGRNYSARGTNRATTKRQPGSTAKILFDYGPYIEYLNGSPATLFLDEPTTYSNGTSIKNSDSKYNGLMTMRDALAASRNIPALRAFQAVYNENPDYIKNFVKSLGIDYGDELYESASIGGFDGVSPVQMSAAYAAYGRGGYYIKPYSYTEATLLNNEKVFTKKSEKVKVMSEETAYIITDMLITAAKRGVGGVSVNGTQIAAKSGTTNLDKATTEKLGIPASATRDAWNITYSSEYAIALWIGYDVNNSEHYLTSNIGVKVRNAVMKAVGSRVYSKNKTFSIPSGIIEVEVEKETIPISLASEYTPESLKMTEIFKEGTEPTENSIRFEKLANPTNGSASNDGTQIKLKWTGINTPDAINTTYLQEYFNKYFDTSASKYYEERITYNNNYVGSLGYNIYEKSSDGTLKYIGRTDNTNYTITNPSGGNVTYVIKSAYSLFTANMSDGLQITVNTAIDSNIEDIVSPGQNDDNNNNNKNNTSNNDDLD